MDKPVILVVADPATWGTLEHDLERRFGADYRIFAAESATAGLTALQAMQATGDEVAIVLVAPQLPEMTGVAFLDQTDDLHSTARRGLLVAPGPVGMTEPVRRAILFNHIDFQIGWPWVSPEEWLYPAISDALSEWVRLHRPHDVAVTIIDRRWDARGHDVRDLLERSGVPYGFYTVDSPRGQQLLAEHGISDDQLPVAIHRDGTVLRDPSNEALASAIGVATQLPSDQVDVVIIGAGPAGLAAAVYGSSEGLQTVVVESGALGGQAATSNQILNYLGFPRGLSGQELTTRAYFQALLFGTLFVFTRRAVDLRADNGLHRVTFDNGATIMSKAVVVAGGNDPRHLGIPTLDALFGRGVFYGATGSEAAALQGEAVAVVGGGNSAGQAALHLAEYAARVTLLVRGDSLAPGMSEYLIQNIEEAGNIEVRLNTAVADAIGKRRLRGLVLEERTTGTQEQMPVTALFVEIGGQPQTGWLPATVARDKHGQILTGRELLTDPAGTSISPLERMPFPLETSLPGVFAAGDVRSGSIERVAAAVGDGAVVIRSVQEYLQEYLKDATSPARTASAPVAAARGAP